MLAGHRAINPGEKLYTNLAGITIHRDDLMKINDEDFVSEFFRAAGLLRRLNLSNSDVALMKGITLLSRGKNCAPASSRRQALRVCPRPSTFPQTQNWGDFLHSKLPLFLLCNFSPDF